MKKTLLSLSLLLGATIAVFAQETPDYQRFQFTSSTDTYTPLSSSATLAEFILDPEFEETFWDESITDTISMPFPFTYQNVTINNFIINSNGALIFNEVYNEVEFQLMGLFMDYSATEDRGDVLYETVGTIGHRILKIEFQNVSSYNNYTGNDTFNFQIWLHEGSNVIEYRAGMCNVASSHFVQSITDLESETPKEVLISCVVSNVGDTLAEEYSELYLHNVKFEDGSYTSNINKFDEIEENDEAIVGILLNEYPANGQVFRFTPIVVPSGINSIPVQSVAVYPNPASDVLNISFANQTIDNGTYILYDVYGKVLVQQTFNGKSIDVSGITAGQYFVQIKDHKNSAVVNFVKL